MRHRFAFYWNNIFLDWFELVASTAGRGRRSTNQWRLVCTICLCDVSTQPTKSGRSLFEVMNRSIQYLYTQSITRDYDMNGKVGHTYSSLFPPQTVVLYFWWFTVVAWRPFLLRPITVLWVRMLKHQLSSQAKLKTFICTSPPPPPHLLLPAALSSIVFIQRFLCTCYSLIIETLRSTFAPTEM
jgi:hypothetical protein